MMTGLHKSAKIAWLMGVLVCFNLISCNQNEESTAEPTATPASNPYENATPGAETAAGIAPPKLSDTANIKDPLAKDSLRMHVAFQLAANELSGAYINKDAATYAKYTMPSIIKANGGEATYKQKLDMVFKDPGTPSYFKVLSGPLQRTKAKLDDQGYLQGWYCLLPVRMYRTEAGKTLQDIKWMGGQSLDEGKTIYFIDITNLPPEKIAQIMPDLQVVLVK
ncbi:MAG: hypothetical protein ACKOXR_07940 [Bacteroidota bacterium]